MKKTMLQFHATLEELVEYINTVNTEFCLSITLMIPRPYMLKGVDDEVSADDLMLDENIRIIFTQEKADTNASSPNNFYDLNPGSIGLHIGRLTRDGLKESALAFMSDDIEKISLANKLASKLKKLTKAGATAVNPVNGAEANIRSHRYTAGAKYMYDKGVKMLPVAGNCYFKFPD